VLLIAYFSAPAFVSSELQRKHEVTPVQKVIDLLLRLREGIEDGGKKEAVSYDKFSCFCKEQADNKVYAINRSSLKMEAFQASIDELGSSVAELDEDVSNLKSTILTEQDAHNTSSTQRSQEKATHEKSRAELVESVSAIGRAIAALEASKTGVQSASFLSKQVKGWAKDYLAGLASPGEASPYDFKSGDVLATLNELHRTFKAKLAEKDTGEATTHHDFNMVEGARAMRIKFAQEEADLKEAQSAKKAQEKSEKAQLLAEETSAKNADQSFLDELTKSCEAKATAWEERSKTRADEVKSITDALEVLQGAAPLYSANKKLVAAFIEVSQGQHRAVLRRRQLIVAQQGRNTSAGSKPQVNRNLKSVVARLAQRLGSSALAQLAGKLTTVQGLGDDHFVKVRGLIKDLITRLEQDAIDEATAKSNCDKQMKAGIETRDSKQVEVETLSANLEVAEATVKKLAGEIITLQEEIAAQHKALNEMIELRNEERAANNQTITEATVGAAEVKEAIQILSDFYDGQVPVLLQQDPASRTNVSGADRFGNTVGDVAPEVFEGDYRGKQQSSKGILGLLEVIVSDFERTATTTQEREDAAEGEFQHQNELITDEIDTKTKGKTGKEEEKTLKEAEIVDLKDDLRSATTLHAEALESLEKLKASCVDAEESWEERKAEREKEIEALKQALQILDEWKG
jgi:hypothetical protein